MHPFSSPSLGNEYFPKLLSTLSPRQGLAMMVVIAEGIAKGVTSDRFHPSISWSFWAAPSCMSGRDAV